MKIDSADFLPEGRAFGPYTVEGAVGAGTFGVVYRARKGRLGKRKALKLLKREHAMNPSIVARFLREAEALAAIHDENVVAVEDVGEIDGRHFIEMEFLEGRSLSSELKEVPRRSLEEALDVALPVASGLHAAHTSPMRLVHRDLKPDNIVLVSSPGGRVVPKVIDFGVAHASGGGQEMTGTGDVIGTPSYMSPEQVQGGRGIDGRADQWALAVILFVMLTGRRPFYAPEGALQTGMLIVSGDTPALRDDGVMIDPWAEAAMRKALSKMAGDRFGSMREFALALAPYARPETCARFKARWPLGAEEETTPMHAPPPTPTRRPVSAPTPLAASPFDRYGEGVAMRAGGAAAPASGNAARGNEGAASTEGGAAREEGVAKDRHGGAAQGNPRRATTEPRASAEAFEAATMPRAVLPPEERPIPATLTLREPPAPATEVAPRNGFPEGGSAEDTPLLSDAAVERRAMSPERRRALSRVLASVAGVAALGLALVATRVFNRAPEREARPAAGDAASFPAAATSVHPNLAGDAPATAAPVVTSQTTATSPTAPPSAPPAAAVAPRPLAMRGAAPMPRPNAPVQRTVVAAPPDGSYAQRTLAEAPPAPSEVEVSARLSAPPSAPSSTGTPAEAPSSAPQLVIDSNGRPHYVRLRRPVQAAQATAADAGAP